MKILFTNAGRRTYLIEDAIDLSLKVGFDVEVFVSDTSSFTAAMMVDSRVRSVITPRVSDDPSKYASELMRQCKNHSIDLVIPLMDYELEILSASRAEFKKIGVELLVSSEEVVVNTLNKEKCLAYLRSHGFDMPKTWVSGQIVDERFRKGPIVLKRVEGSGSVDLKIFSALENVPEVVPDNFIMQEFIIGQEYGMDILNDQNGNFVHCCVKKKHSMRGGETDKAEVIYDELFHDYGRRISETFRHVGNMDVDFIMDSKGDVFFIDFNPRFGGGYPFTKAAGFDYLLAIINNFNGIDNEMPLAGPRVQAAKGIKIFSLEVK